MEKVVVEFFIEKQRYYESEIDDRWIYGLIAGQVRVAESMQYLSKEDALKAAKLFSGLFHEAIEIVITIDE